MEFKASEILIIAAVLLLPVGAFTFIFWPGAYGAALALATSPAGLPIACAIGVVAAGVMLIARRLPKRKRSAEAENFTSFWKTLWKG